MDAQTKAVLVRAGSTLIVASVIVVTALMLNAPSTVRVDFDIVCRSFVLPTEVTLDLNEAPTQMTSGEFYGFDGSVVGKGLVVKNLGDPTALKPTPSTGTWHLLRPSADSPTPFLKVTPAGPLSADTAVDLRKGVALSVGGDGVLVADTAVPQSIRFRMQSGLAEFEAERYPMAKFVVESQPPGPETVLSAMTLPAGVRARLDLRFVPRQGERRLLASATPLTAGTHNFIFRAALPRAIAVGGRELPSLQRDRELDVTMSGESGEITDISLAPTPKEEDAPLLHIAGWITTHSVRQGGVERLPTWVEEALDTSRLARSLSITALALAAFVLFKAVGGALDALLKLWLGD